MLVCVATASIGCGRIDYDPLGGARHGGWSRVYAVGRTVTRDDVRAPAEVTIGWSPMTPVSGTVESWAVYRATRPDGHDFSASLADGLPLDVREYTDTDVEPGITYYYVVRPVIGGVAAATVESFSRLRVIVPPDNMALVHRWMANQEMCQLMGKESDPAEDYRCSYTGPGSRAGYYDLGHDLLADRFETGCAFTAAPACSPNGCIGDGLPVNVPVEVGDVHYDRGSGQCYIRDPTGWLTTADGLTLDQLAAIASSEPHLPPLIWLNQEETWHTCAGRSASVNGSMVAKRTLSRLEQLAAAAWDADLSDADILAREQGAELPATGNCNTNVASGLIYEDGAVPTGDPDTLPSTLTNTMLRTVRTGSDATRNCVSRYGLQDHVGNVWEYLSDQLESCVDTTCVGIASRLDPDNVAFEGLVFDATAHQSGAVTGMWSFDQSSAIVVPIGVPVGADAPAEYEALAPGTGPGAFDPAAFHDDTYHLWVSWGDYTRGAIAGGRFDDPVQGRFGLNVNRNAVDRDVYHGTRCGIRVDYP